MDLEKRAFEIIKSIEYLNIASSSKDNTPWNTPVYAVADNNLNFYWSSWFNAQHSLNIIENPKVFCSLYDSTRERGDNNRRCLYLEGLANEVTESKEIKKAVELLYESQDTSDFNMDSLRRIYKTSINKIWLNDISERQVTKETIKMRIPVNLERLKDFF